MSLAKNCIVYQLQYRQTQSFYKKKTLYVVGKSKVNFKITEACLKMQESHQKLWLLLGHVLQISTNILISYHLISIYLSIYLSTYLVPTYLSIYIYIYTNYIIKYISMYIYIYIRWTCEHILTLRFAALILTLGVGTSSRHCCSWLVWRWAKQRLAITTAHSSPFSSPWNRGDLPPIIPKCLAILVLKAMVTWGCPIFRKPHISGRFQRSWTPMDHDPRLWLDPAV